jgi:phosphoribosylformylglycinamidine cyclo-ligase
MTGSRLLHVLRAPATSPAPAAGRGPAHPQSVRFPQAGEGMRRVSVACSSSTGGEGEGEGMTYKGAGVDIDAGTELVRRIRKMAPVADHPKINPD